MRIMGIDPGIATIGFGVLDSEKNSHKLIQCGVITTPAHTSLSSRLEQIYDDMGQILDAFKQARACESKPTAIIAETTKGKGVSFMAGDAGWHGKAANDEQTEQALAELDQLLQEQKKALEV